MLDGSSTTPTLTSSLASFSFPVLRPRTERLVTRARLGWRFELAASGFVVLGSTLGGQATTCFDGQLFTSADRELDVLSFRQFALPIQVEQSSGHPCIGNARCP